VFVIRELNQCMEVGSGDPATELKEWGAGGRVVVGFESTRGQDKLWRVRVTHSGRHF
jgi:hypothetical protein